MELCNRLRVLRIPGVAKLVGFGGTPTALPQMEIDRLRAALTAGVKAEPHPYLAAGQHVRITRGPFVGLNGIVVRRKGRYKLLISLDLIQRSISVELPSEDLQAVQVAVLSHESL